jgi:hypothetical protein
MKTKDVLHLYYGAHCEYQWTAGVHKQNGITRAKISTYLMGLNGIQIKPILRPLHTISAEEYKTYLELEDDCYLFNLEGKTEIRSRAFSPRSLVYLLSRGFDLFDLIDSGQATDATKLEENPYHNESR